MDCDIVGDAYIVSDDDIVQMYVVSKLDILPHNHRTGIVDMRATPGTFTVEYIPLFGDLVP
ncbi:hypothetical protein D1872_306700 [compost metagenome]